MTEIREQFTFLLTLLSEIQRCKHNDKWYLVLGLGVREVIGTDGVCGQLENQCLSIEESLFSSR